MKLNILISPGKLGEVLRFKFGDFNFTLFKCCIKIQMVDMASEYYILQNRSWWECCYFSFPIEEKRVFNTKGIYMDFSWNRNERGSNFEHFLYIELVLVLLSTRLCIG